MNPHVHICSFEAVAPVRQRASYEEFREAVLAAGRFSVFEATATQVSARRYDRLERDPAVRITRLGFPWCRVERA